MKIKTHFFQNDIHSCGECAIRSILAMYGKILYETLRTDSGTSVETMKKILSSYGIHSVQKNITYEKIKRRSISYYPKSDHYVTIEKIKENKLFINDSTKEFGEWVSKDEFLKLWTNGENTGWILQCRLKRRK